MRTYCSILHATLDYHRLAGGGNLCRLIGRITVFPGQSSMHWCWTHGDPSWDDTEGGWVLVTMALAILCADSLLFACDLTWLSLGDLSKAIDVVTLCTFREMSHRGATRFCVWWWQLLAPNSWWWDQKREFSMGSDPTGGHSWKTNLCWDDSYWQRQPPRRAVVLPVMTRRPYVDPFHTSWALCFNTNYIASSLKWLENVQSTCSKPQEKVTPLPRAPIHKC